MGIATRVTNNLNENWTLPIESKYFMSREIEWE